MRHTLGTWGSCLRVSVLDINPEVASVKIKFAIITFVITATQTPGWLNKEQSKHPLICVHLLQRSLHAFKTETREETSIKWMWWHIKPCTKQTVSVTHFLLLYFPSSLFMRHRHKDGGGCWGSLQTICGLITFVHFSWTHFLFPELCNLKSKLGVGEHVFRVLIIMFVLLGTPCCHPPGRSGQTFHLVMWLPVVLFWKNQVIVV